MKILFNRPPEFPLDFRQSAFGARDVIQALSREIVHIPGENIAVLELLDSSTSAIRSAVDSAYPADYVEQRFEVVPVLVSTSPVVVLE